MTFDDRFLAAQQAYYNARAAEYNEWWERRGRYDHGPQENGAWFREQDELFTRLEQLDLRGEVLELACGTGNWTHRLLRTADRVTALDGSAEMLAVHRSRLDAEQAARVEYVQTDLFAWKPEREYDAVVFGFWLSHVPPDRLDSFLHTVRQALRPGGGLFFVDSARDPSTTSPDQPLPEEEQAWLVRRLNDGREFPIVKVFYDPEGLEASFRRHALPVCVRQTERFFIYGWADQNPGSPPG